MDSDFYIVQLDVYSIGLVSHSRDPCKKIYPLLTIWEENERINEYSVFFLITILGLILYVFQMKQRSHLLQKLSFYQEKKCGGLVDI